MEQFHQLLAVTDTDRSFEGARDSAIVVLLWETGMRRTEFTIAKLSDIDFAARVIVSPRTTKGKSRKAIYLPDATSR